MRRIYLDNAATSWPKPEGVLQAIEQYQQHLGSPAGRSGYATAMDVDKHVNSVRRKAAEFFGASQPQHVVFTAGCTDGLNLVLQSLRQSGGHVITTTLEHNSVLRPIRQLQEEGAIEVTRLPFSLETGCINPADVAKAWRDDTRMVAMIHASNVLGTVQPVREVAEITHKHGGRLLLDAAQTAGHFPCTLQSTGADYLVTAAHKGLLGILGLGLLVLKDEAAADELLPLRFGGTGSKSDLDTQPTSLPDRFEAGSPNLPAIFALGAGLAYITGEEIDKLHQHELALTVRLRERLSQIDGVHVYGPKPSDAPHGCVGVVSLNLDGADPRELATIIDTAAGVEARAGMHCAPLVHKLLGTTQLGGTLRLSLGAFNTDDDVDIAAEVIAEIATEFAA